MRRGHSAVSNSQRLTAKGGVLGRGREASSLPAKESGECCKLPSGVRRRAPAA